MSRACPPAVPLRSGNNSARPRPALLVESRRCRCPEAYAAITRGDTARVRDLLEADPNLATRAEDRAHWPGSTLLEHAVWWHRRDIVELLVAAGAPVDRPGGQPPETPLRRAYGIGADHIVDALRAAASDLESAAALGDVAGVRARLPASDTEQRDAFRVACLNGRRETALALAPDGWFDREALVDALLRGRHLLPHVEGDDAWQFARLQLSLADPRNVFDIDSVDVHGRSAAGAAREGGHEAIAAYLESRAPATPRAAPLDRVWRPSNTPVQQASLFACQWGQTPRVREFLADDPTLAGTYTIWRTGALYLPGAYGSEGSVATALTLLDAGADPFEGIAGPCWWGSTDMVCALLERGAPPDRRSDRESGLRNACAATRYNDCGEPHGWHALIEALLDHGADPDLADPFGVTPWGFAHDETRPLLEARGARPTRRHPGLREHRQSVRSGSPAAGDGDPELLDFYDDVSGCTPALEAWLTGDRALAERLLARKGAPTLNEAAAIGDRDAVRARLDAMGIAGPRAGKAPDGIPLHLAAWCGNAEVVDLLLDRGFSLAATNDADVAGRHLGTPPLRDTTPLHLAARAGHREIVERFASALDEHWSG